MNGPVPEETFQPSLCNVSPYLRSGTGSGRGTGSFLIPELSDDAGLPGKAGGSPKDLRNWELGSGNQRSGMRSPRPWDLPAEIQIRMGAFFNPDS